MRSEPRPVAKLANGIQIYVMFVHTSNITVHALVYAESVGGNIRMIRESHERWVLLTDTLDRKTLFTGIGVSPLPIDVEKVYVDYMVESIVT